MVLQEHKVKFDKWEHGQKTLEQLIALGLKVPVFEYSLAYEFFPENYTNLNNWIPYGIDSRIVHGDILELAPLIELSINETLDLTFIVEFSLIYFVSKDCSPLVKNTCYEVSASIHHLKDLSDYHYLNVRYIRNRSDVSLVDSFYNSKSEPLLR